MAVLKFLAPVVVSALAVLGLSVASSPADAATCTGVAVTTSSNVQSLVNANPSGTTFCFAAGTYTGVSNVVPKSNDVFDGALQTAVLDGGNSRQYAFTDGGSENAGTNDGASGVTIQNFKITNYATPLQRGAITSYSGQNWVIQGNNITGNAAAAVATGDGARVLSNSLSGNTQEGFSAQGTGGFYDHNTISENNTALTVDGTWEAGGGKAWATTNLTFTNNTVNHNGGPGFWADTNNIGTDVENNTVDNNWGSGIYEEISYNFTIKNNDVEGNGTSAAPGGGQNLGWAWDAGIQVRRSQGLTGFTSVISGNKVANNYNAISLINSPSSGCTGSGEGQYGPCKVANVHVDGNGVTMAQGAVGAYEDSSGTSIWSTDGNELGGNAYCVASASPPNGNPSYGWLSWQNGWPSFFQWQGFGNDTAGTFTVTPSVCAVPGTGGGGGGTTVTYDASSGGKKANASSLSFVHTIGTGTNRALLVEATVGADGTSGDVNCVQTVTDNGSAMTKLATIHTNNQHNGYVNIWGMANPPSGANTIVESVSGCNTGVPNELTAGGESFTGVSQATPFGAVTSAVGSSATPSVTSVSVTGDMMAGFVANGSAITSATAPSVSRFTENQDGNTGAGNSAGATSAATGSNVTMAWSVDSDWWAAGIVDVHHA